MREPAKTYAPAELEPRWLKRWLEEDCFVADPHSDTGEAYSIVLPPPNVTGSLHMGHALGNTLQDILIRYRRMKGDATLWLPGIDHAGIATQTVVERSLRRKGLERTEIGREAFLEHVWAWKEAYGDRIALQMERHGSSLDPTRRRFTMDEGSSRVVREVFVRLHEQGLLYRDDRLVNWDPISRTGLSDLEVEQEEEDGFLWHMAYPVVGSEDVLVVATTRPETLFGDEAVAIHPDDPRYLHLHGREVALPLTDRTIPIITDAEAVDMTFGSGAVKITPAHDFNDFETGRRHQLPRRAVLDLDARLNENVPEAWRGLSREEARTRVLEELRTRGQLVREEAYRYAPGRSQRSGAIVEPLSIGMQWFIRMEPLARPAIEAVRDGRIRIEPPGWEKTYFHWMENIRDWCVSRQLWWGHRIPAWTCERCGALHVVREDPTACSECGHSSLQQDEDVLDTWFSSALWPFSTLGWPEDTPEFRRFYPTAVLETGFDILFFWVARMIMMGLHFTGEVPFRTVFLHAMVRDRHGRKMSKTVGNVIDPLHIIDGIRPQDLSTDEREIYAQLLEDYPEGVGPQGADALRLTLAVAAAAGRDIRLDIRRIEGYRAFLNKVWNASRFAWMHLHDAETPPHPRDLVAHLSQADRWILHELETTRALTEEALGAYRFNDAAQILYAFVWHQVCDWYVELVKPVFFEENNASDDVRQAARATLRHVLDTTFRLLHPMVPFVTEELWQTLDFAREGERFLTNARWPEPEPDLLDAESAHRIRLTISTITGLRRIRGESQVPAGRNIPEVLLKTPDQATRAMLEEQAVHIRRLTRTDALRFLSTEDSPPPQCATTVADGIEIHVPLAGLVDVDAERTRLQKELDKAQKDIAFFERKLNNPRFVEKAPPEVVAEDRARLAAAIDARTTLQAGLQRLDELS